MPLVAVLGPSCANAEGLAAAEKLVSDRPEVGAMLIDRGAVDRPVPAGAPRRRQRRVAAPVDTAQLAEAVRRGRRDARPASHAAVARPASRGRRASSARSSPCSRRRAGRQVGHRRQPRRRAGPAQRPARGARRRRPAVRRRRRDAQARAAAHDRRCRRLARSPRRGAAPEPARAARAVGLFVLPAPLEPAFADQIGADEMVRIVELLRTFC